MPSGHNDPLRSILESIAERFAAEISAAVMEHVESRVRDEVQAVISRAFAGPRAGLTRAGRRAVARPARNVRVCRVPGCGKPSKGPRYDFFCAEHRDLPDDEKERIRKAQAGQPPAPIAAAEPAEAAPAPGRAKKNGARKARPARGRKAAKAA
jgi:hypothetical protein